MTEQDTKSCYKGNVFCDELPLLEDDRMRLGLADIVDISLKPGAEEDVMNVTLYVPSEINSADTLQLQMMLLLWDHKFTVVTA